MNKTKAIKLQDGSRVAVIGGGPAGSFFSYFLLDMARRVGLNLSVEIYEPRDFTRPGPAGCNMCGGVVSESLVQLLSAEGIILPSTVVQRGIDSYVVHMKEGAVRIETPHHEKRIAVVHRGAGPRGSRNQKWIGLDGYLLKLAVDKGARHVRARVDQINWNAGRLEMRTQPGSSPQIFDLLAVTTGVNTATLQHFERLGLGYKAPRTTSTYIGEIHLGQAKVEERLGNSMHVFLLDLPRVEFAALIPKGDYVTMCILGDQIDGQVVSAFIESPQVKECLPSGWIAPRDMCHCSPRINVGGAAQPYADRLVFIGDCAVTRLYKDGIGGAYRAAKTAAVTAIFEGISKQDFRRHYAPACRAMALDNLFGKVVFAIAGVQQKIRHDRRGILRMLAREQTSDTVDRPMSLVMWDMFTGSATYREVFNRTLHPSFWARLLWEIVADTIKSRSGVGDCEEIRA